MIDTESDSEDEHNLKTEDSQARARAEQFLSARAHSRGDESRLSLERLSDMEDSTRDLASLSYYPVLPSPFAGENPLVMDWRRQDGAGFSAKDAASVVPEGHIISRAGMFGELSRSVSGKVGMNQGAPKEDVGGAQMEGPPLREEEEGEEGEEEEKELEEGPGSAVSKQEMEEAAAVDREGSDEKQPQEAEKTVFAGDKKPSRRNKRLSSASQLALDGIDKFRLEVVGFRQTVDEIRSGLQSTAYTDSEVQKQCGVLRQLAGEFDRLQFGSLDSVTTENLTSGKSDVRSFRKKIHKEIEDLRKQVSEALQMAKECTTREPTQEEREEADKARMRDELERVAEVKELNKRGRSLAQMQKLDDAAATFRHALQLIPEHASSLHNLGSALQGNGQMEEAAAVYKRALDVQPDHAKTLANLGTTLAVGGKLDEAIEVWRRALVVRPDHTPTLNNIANALRSVPGREEECAEMYRRMNSLLPDNPSALCDMASVLRRLGRNEEAIKAFKAALLLRPDDSRAMIHLAGVLRDQGDMQRAIALLEHNLSRHPDSGEAQVALARTLDAAVAAFTAEVQSCEADTTAAQDGSSADGALASKTACAWNQLGIVQAMRKDFQSAIHSYKRALILAPQDPPTLHNLAKAYHESGFLDEAVTQWNLLRRVDPTDTDMLIGVANFFELTDQFAQAMEAYEAALEVDPDNAQAVYGLGIALDDSGQAERAVEVLTRAHNLRPNHVNTLMNLGVALGHCEDDPENRLRGSVRALESALVLSDAAEGVNSDEEDRGDVGLLVELGIALRRTGKHKRSVEVLRRATSVTDTGVSENKAAQRELNESLRLAHDCFRAALAEKPEDVGVMNDLGVVYTAQGKTADAIDIYRQALAVDPHSCTTLQSLAVVLKSAGRSLESADVCRRLLETHPDDVVILNTLAAALCASKTEGTLAEALSVYDRVLAIAPNDPHTLYNMAIALDDDGQSVRAVDMFSRAAELRPGHANTHMNMGMALEHCAIDGDGAVNRNSGGLRGRASSTASVNSREFYEHVESAVVAYRTALALRPDDTEIHNLLAGALKRIGRGDEALEVYERVLALVDQQSQQQWSSARLSQVLNNLGSLLSMLNRGEEALPYFRRAFRHDPQHATTLHNLGNALQANGHVAEATEVFERALELNPTHAKTLSNYGLALAMLGRLDAAVEAWTRSLVTRPAHTATLNNLANALMKLGKVGEAIPKYRAVLENNPSDPVTNFNLGVALKGKGAMEDAELLFRVANDARPGHVPTLFNLGIVLHAQRHLEEAERAFRKVLDLRPSGHAQAFFHLACVRCALGVPDEAIAFLERAAGAGFCDADRCSRAKDLDALRSRRQPNPVDAEIFARYAEVSRSMHEKIRLKREGAI